MKISNKKRRRNLSKKFRRVLQQTKLRKLKTVSKSRDLNSPSQVNGKNPKKKDSSNEGKVNWVSWFGGRAITGFFSAIVRKILDSFWDS